MIIKYSLVPIWLCLVVVNTFQVHADYQGSHAFNVSKPFHTQVNVATGDFSFTYPVLSLKGKRETWQLKLQYQYNQAGLNGLPSGWAFNLDHVDHKTVSLNGQQWLIDPLWRDESLYASGLRYLNQHGCRFDDFSVSRTVPNHSGYYYRYSATFKDGSVKYFSESGLLIAQIDRFDNAILFEYDKIHQSARTSRLAAIIDNYGNRYAIDYLPSLIKVLSPNASKTSIFYNDKAVLAIENPEQERLDIHYDDYGKWSLIQAIETAEGLGIYLTYSDIFAKVDDAVTTLPVVSELRYKDLSTQQLIKQSYYTYAKGKNFTGYPLYSFSKNRDSLLESNDQNYRYRVEVRQNSLDVDDSPMLTKVYTFNSLHLPVDIETLAGDKPYGRVLYEYPVTSFKSARATNYDKPKKEIHQIWRDQHSDYQSVWQLTQAFDNFGNSIKQVHQLYDPKAKVWRNKMSVDVAFYTEHFSLPSHVIKEDGVTGKKIQKVFTLSEDGKTIKQIATSYQADNQSSSAWLPWKQQDIHYDSAGRKSFHQTFWLEEGHKGPDKTAKSYRYMFNDETKLIKKISRNVAGHEWITETDAITGLVKSVRSPMGATTQFTYDRVGRLLQKIDALGNASYRAYKHFKRDGKNAVIKTDATGRMERALFDAKRRHTVTEDFSLGYWRLLHAFTYNGFDNVIEKEDRFGNKSRMRFDRLQRLIAKTDPWGNQAEIVYKDVDFTSEFLMNGHLIKTMVQKPWEFNLIESSYPFTANPLDAQPNFSQTLTEVNGFGQPTRVKYSEVDKSTFDERRYLDTHFTYDVEGHVIEQFVQADDGLIKKVHKDYDLFGHLVFQHQSEKTGDVTHEHDTLEYTYDADGLLVKEASLSTNTTPAFVKTFEYDADGHLSHEHLNSGEVIHYTYDALGYLVSSRWPRHQEEYALSMQYDELNRLREIKDNKGDSLKFDFSTRGLLSGIHYGDGKSVSYDYDQHDLVSAMKNANGEVTHFDYAKAGKGKLTGLKTDNYNLQLVYGVDDNGNHGSLIEKHLVPSSSALAEQHIAIRYGALQLAAKTVMQDKQGQPYYTLELTHDLQHQVVGKTVSWRGEKKQSDRYYQQAYSYDSAKRVIQERYKDDQAPHWLTTQYAYDGMDNILRETHLRSEDVLFDRRYAYNALNQCKGFTEKDHFYPLHYDSNGRLSKDQDGASYRYDAKQFLVEITAKNGEKTNFSYYPNGLLRQVTREDKTRAFYYDANYQAVSQVVDKEAQSIQRLGTDIVSIDGKNDSTAFLPGFLSPGATKHSTSALQPFAHLAYGQSINPDQDQMSSFAWLNEFTDSRHNLTYLKSRFYHQPTRRFLTPDMKFVLNRYAYAGGDPVNCKDADGFSPAPYAIGGLLIAGSIAGAVWSVLATPFTGGASLVVGATGVTAGALGATSGTTMIAAQAMADKGNESAASALMKVSITAGALAAITGIGGLYFAPDIAGALGLGAQAQVEGALIEMQTLAPLHSESFTSVSSLSSRASQVVLSDSAPNPLYDTSALSSLESLEDVNQPIAGAASRAGAADEASLIANPGQVVQHVEEPVNVDIDMFQPIELNVLNAPGVEVVDFVEAPVRYMMENGGLMTGRNWAVGFRLRDGALLDPRIGLADGITTVVLMYRYHVSEGIGHFVRGISVFNEQYMSEPQLWTTPDITFPVFSG